jgi:CubicO group peptidase (beta-lactamase class C family)
MKTLFPTVLATFSLALTVPGQVPSLSPGQITSPPTEPSPAAQTPPKSPETATHPLTKEDAESWLDGFMPYALGSGDIAGAVITVVKDGAILLEKGYGYADVAEHKPVDPATTLFRAGSVSKLFTWTAVMQLVEQGKVDLDADVNTYLDFKIPPRNGKPITLRNLMTHTPGFDEAVRALLLTDPKDLPTLEQALKHWIPPRVTDAGSTPAYSNYGAAVAGYIVQRVSGLSFEDYIEQKIFAPLGMHYASFRQPLPDALRPYMSKGYKVGSGEPQPFELVDVAPAGSLSISGHDMAPFMIAHLQNGAFGSTRILQEATAVKMHGTRSVIIPPLNSMLLGFYESNSNGHRVISHGGDTELFHSDLNLLPDDGVGFFFSVNSFGKNGAAHAIRAEFLTEFMGRYFPGPAPSGLVTPQVAKEHGRLIAGRYTTTRRAHTSFLSLLNFLGEIPVVANSDGTITVEMLKGLNDQPIKFKEIAPFVWRDVTGSNRIAAEVKDGRLVRFGYDPYPFMLFEPVGWWWSSAWLLPLWIAALAALALTVLAWPISALIRRRYGVAYGLTGADARAHRLVRIAALFMLAIMIGWAAAVTLMASNLKWTGPGMDGWIIFLRLLTLVIFFGGTLVALWNAGAVLRSDRRILAKIWSVILALSCLTVLYVSVIFHLVGYSANY